jgi:plastocyanin domain-containing protein
MTNRGLALSGVNIPVASSGSGSVAKIEGGVQVVTTSMESGRYSPVIVQKGIPVKWTIKVEKGDLNGCNNPVTIPQYNIQKKLVVGDNIIEFTPESEGNILYTCWMGMISSNIKVVPDLSKVSDKDLQNSGNGGTLGGGTIPTDEAAIGEIRNGVQYVRIDVVDERFSPALVIMQKGIETRWVINGKELTSHNSSLIFPEYNARIDLDTGENEIELEPEQDFTFLCITGTLNGYVKVVEDINKINIDDIKKEVENYTVPPISINSGNGGASCH